MRPSRAECSRQPPWRSSTQPAGTTAETLHSTHTETRRQKIGSPPPWGGWIRLTFTENFSWKTKKKESIPFVVYYSSATRFSIITFRICFENFRIYLNLHYLSTTLSSYDYIHTHFSHLDRQYLLVTEVLHHAGMLAQQWFTPGFKNTEFLPHFSEFRIDDYFFFF